MVSHFRCARDRHLAFRVKRLLTANRIDHDRRGIRCPEQLHTGVDLAHVDQATRPQRPPLEPFAIGSNGTIVVGACRQIPPVRDRNFLFGDGFEIEDAQPLLRTLDEWLLHGRLRQLVRDIERPVAVARCGADKSLECRRIETGSGEQGTASEKCHKLAA